LEVSADDVRSALQAYVEERVPGDEIEEWANALECREDLKIAGSVKVVIHALANPILTQPRSRQVALQLIASLSKANTSLVPTPDTA
jgi:hypothetical protein